MCSALESIKRASDRYVDTCRYDIIPDVVKAIHDFALFTLRNCFFMVPLVAYCLNHNKQAVLSLAIGTIGLIDRSFRSRNFREFASVLVGIPVAVQLALQVLRVVTQFSSIYIVSILLQSICFAKLALIGKGANYMTRSFSNFR